MKTAEGIGAWHNQYNTRPLEECVRRAKQARLDFVIIKYGFPKAEQAYRDGGIPWATERFAYAWQAPLEGQLLADAVDAGAVFAVINAEEGGGWGDNESGAEKMSKIIDIFRRRHPTVSLYACLDTRGGRLSHPYQQIALERCDGIMPMVYPAAFYLDREPNYIARAFEDVFRGKDFKGKPVYPVLQSYGEALGPQGIREQFDRAQAWGNGCSFYTIHHATDAEWEEVSSLKLQPAPGPDPLTVCQKIAAELTYRIEAVKLAADGKWSDLHDTLHEKERLS